MAKKNSGEVLVDRRADQDRRADSDRRQQSVEVDADRRNEDRRKVPRRRQIDPTTCERDYTDHEIEFMQALDAYKRANGRMFPTCSEILEVIRDLGYVRLSPDVAGDQLDELFERPEVSAKTGTDDETAKGA